MVEAFNNGGIKTYLAGVKKVSEIVEQIKTNELAEIDPRQVTQSKSGMTKPEFSLRD